MIVLFDVHKSVDNKPERWMNDLTTDLVHHRIPYGICSRGARRLDDWISLPSLDSFIRHSRFIILNTELPGDSRVRKDKPAKAQENRTSVEQVRKAGFPGIPVREVFGTKTDVAHLLGCPALLFDDREDNCYDMKINGPRGSEFMQCQSHDEEFYNRLPVNRGIGPRPLSRWIGKILLEWPLYR